MNNATLLKSLLVALGAIASPQHLRGAPPASPLQLVENTKAESTFSWEQLKSGSAVIAIWNGSDVTQDATVKVTDFTLPGKNESVGPIIVCDSRSKPQKLEALKISRIALELDGQNASPPPGLYSGFVTVQDVRKAFAPYSKQLTLKVTGPQSAVSKLTMLAWRLIPFTPLWCAKVKVPLKQSDFLPQLKNTGVPVGFVQRDAGGVATVWWSGTQTSCHGFPVAKLTIDELPHAGKYDGEVSFNKEDIKTGTVALSVIAKDIAVWPILVIAGGIYIAFLAKRYLGVLRITWALREQEADLGRTLQEAQKQFATATGGTPSGAYSVAADVATQREQIVKLLDAIEKTRWSTNLSNNSDYTAATKALQVLKDQIYTWGQLGQELRSLSEILSSAWSEVDGKSQIPPQSPPDEPEVLKRARALLVGRVIKGEEIDPLRRQVAEAVNLVKVWTDVNRRAKNVTAQWARSQSRPDLNDAQKTILAAVKDQLVGVWKHLWEAQSGGDLASLSANGGDLDAAEISLARIASAATADIAASSFSLTGALLFATHAVPSFSAFTAWSDVTLPVSDDRRLDLLTRAIRYGDWLSAILAFLIALLTGLNANYLGGKPFGTLLDYILLFLWAAGTKATLDILTSILDKFSSSSSKGALPS